MARQGVSTGAMLVFPLVAFLIVFFAYPVASMLLRSVEPGVWTLDAYRELLEGGVFWKVIEITLEIGATVTLSCLLLAFPLAYWLARLPQATASLALILVLVPFWTSILVRSYAWMALLERHGIVNNLLLALHLIDAPVKLLNTRLSVCLAMIHVLLPFMVLPIYATLERLDPRLIEAAYDLYANRVQLFRRVVWPLTKPGVAAGTVLVFAPALGAFLQPDLLGGGKQLLIGSLIEMQFTSSRNWPFGAALATLVTLAVVAALVWQNRRGKSVEAQA